MRNASILALSLFCLVACVGRFSPAAVTNDLADGEDVDCARLSYFKNGETLASIAYSGSWAERLCGRLYKEDGQYRAATGIVLVTYDGERQISSAENVSEAVVSELLVSTETRLALITQRLMTACKLPDGSVILGGEYKFLEISNDRVRSRLERQAYDPDYRASCDDDGSLLIDDTMKAILKLAPLKIGDVCRTDPYRPICQLSPGFSIGD